MWNGAAETLNASPQIRNTRPKIRPDRRRRRPRSRRIPVIAGEAVDQAGPVQQQARRQGPQHEILQARFRRLQVVAVEGGQHIGPANAARSRHTARSGRPRTPSCPCPASQDDQDRIFEALHLRRLHPPPDTIRPAPPRIDHDLAEQRQRHAIQPAVEGSALANAEMASPAELRQTRRPTPPTGSRSRRSRPDFSPMKAPSSSSDQTERDERSSPEGEGMSARRWS